MSKIVYTCLVVDIISIVIQHAYLKYKKIGGRMKLAVDTKDYSYKNRRCERFLTARIIRGRELSH